MAGRRELEFLRVIGHGGFGSVYLANLRTSSGIVRPVAVKIMKPGLEAEPELLARQRDEARLLGRINHDAFVKVLDLTTIEGRPAVVMDFVTGADVAELLATGPIPPAAALELLAAAAGALDAAWNGVDPVSGAPLHVVHRDIKPANLLVTPDGAVKVLDFGIARAEFDDREGRTGSNLFGTPRFMSPEQWAGGAYGPEVDVYALGVTLFEMLTGRKWERCPLTPGAFEVQRNELLDAGDLDPRVRALISDMTGYDGKARLYAHEVRVRSAELAGEIGGERLLPWAGRAVKPLVGAREAVTGTLPDPHSLSEQSLAPIGNTLPPPPADDASSARTVGVGIAGAFAGVLVTAAVLTVLAGGAWFLVGRPETPAPAAEPIVDAVPAPVPTFTPVEVEAPAAAPVAEPVVPKKSAKKEEPAPVATPDVALYELHVTTEPIGASVWIDGKAVGHTPNARARLAEGSHSVAVELVGYDRAERDATVSAATARGLRYNFTEKTWHSIR